jgi:hypothetical protein
MLPTAPVNPYRISRQACNSAIIFPPVGKKFTATQQQQLMEWAKAGGLHAHIQGTGVYVIATCGTDILSLLPRPVTKKQVDAQAKKQVHDAEVRETKAARRSELIASPAVPWLDEIFGADFANDYNKNALARFLDGKDKKFQGLPNNRWLPGLEKLGIPADNNAVPAIKKAYENR